MLQEIISISKFIISIVTASLAVFKGIAEYRKNATQKRAEYFLKTRDKIFNDPDFNKVCNALDITPTNVASLTVDEKETFLGYMEEIALLMYSELIPKNTVHYMFGYYAILCWKNNVFWSNINKKHRYWSLFNKFAEEMISIKNIDLNNVRL
ncbi:hypothetical protein OR1_03501 [Geobacter sp. OR-1]|uniref:hypothetical protein n=1 Tax=Geobacter sp. OR-1 TaxID=1266765 RepID=UPI0005420594|nr:hypothetical protein [Geobacter sp. OR-1]GAM11191.1 hypothetical protein OR1_03501 [Geobacter sp. OR-1]